ncbi:acyltransferase family protein [Pseudomonas sp. RIT-To-2]|uniref:acyltransferase family protein n=1 Tax=Pseudomonas sp. RIT-To-2 TaxID=3462541 RepID=UPI0024136540
MAVLAYRRDIDGLRAVAVAIVVLFHFGIAGFSGGFVGVDIFFVISGFLITSILWRQHQAGQFSFLEFWTRRARRILPALFLVMVVCMVVGWFLLTPHDYSDLGRSVRYQAMFASNILFQRQDGYFDTASDLKPLLHTWSLAVEEQFYIVFPLLLGLLIRYLRRWRLCLLGLLLVSLALSVWAVRHDPSAAFFLLPMRAWELLAGALLAVTPIAASRQAPWVYQLASLVGVAMLVAATVFYDAHTPFPGVAALLPVVGTLALIWANGAHATWVGRVLSTRLMVGTGLISYSWYLWHWPVHVFASYAAVDGLSALQVAGLLVLSLVLAYASWRWFERPLRQGRVSASARQVLACALGLMVLVGVAGQALRQADGVPSRLSPQALRYAQAREWNAGQRDCLSDRKAQQPVCTLGPAGPPPPAMLVWGDSHAAGMGPALALAAKDHGTPVSLAARAGCIPVPGLEGKRACRDFNGTMLALAQAPAVHDVVLAARWSLYLYGDGLGDTTYMLHTPQGRADRHYAEQQLATQLAALVARLREQHRRVWLVEEAPLQKQRVPYRLTRLAMLGRPVANEGLPLAEHRRRQAFISQLFGQLAAADSNVRIIDPAALFCSDGHTCRIEADGQSLYMDDNHYGDGATAYLQPLLAPLFERGAGATDSGRIQANSAD